MSNYNERNPTISYRVEKKEKNHLDRVAEKKKMTVNELAKDILSKYLKGDLILAKDDQQKELTQLRIEKIKAEIEYLKIKNKFAENFNAPMTRAATIAIKPAIMGESETNWKEWEQKTQNPQSPYDAKNKRLQCIDCGTLFTWENYEMYNIAIAEFQRHLVSKHNRVKTEIEKDVLLNLSYEGAST